MIAARGAGKFSSITFKERDRRATSCVPMAYGQGTVEIARLVRGLPAFFRRAENFISLRSNDLRRDF
jgi:hypothetical protein